MHKIKEEPFDENDIEKFCLKINRDMNELLNVYVQNNVIQEPEPLSTTKVFQITPSLKRMIFTLKKQNFYFFLHKPMVFKYYQIHLKIPKNIKILKILFFLNVSLPKIVKRNQNILLKKY